MLSAILTAPETGRRALKKHLTSFCLTGQGKITVSYQTDALGHILSGQEKTVTDDSALRKRGVVLTLDKSIQQLAERSLLAYLKKGAAVVLDVPSGKILALASLPSFSQNNVASVLKSADSPLLEPCHFRLQPRFRVQTCRGCFRAGIWHFARHNLYLHRRRRCGRAGVSLLQRRKARDGKHEAGDCQFLQHLFCPSDAESSAGKFSSDGEIARLRERLCRLRRA